MDVFNKVVFDQLRNIYFHYQFIPKARELKTVALFPLARLLGSTVWTGSGPYYQWEPAAGEGTHGDTQFLQEETVVLCCVETSSWTSCTSASHLLPFKAEAVWPGPRGALAPPQTCLHHPHIHNDHVGPEERPHWCSVLAATLPSLAVGSTESYGCQKKEDEVCTCLPLMALITLLPSFITSFRNLLVLSSSTS